MSDLLSIVDVIHCFVIPLPDFFLKVPQLLCVDGQHSVMVSDREAFHPLLSLKSVFSRLFKKDGFPVIDLSGLIVLSTG